MWFAPLIEALRSSEGDKNAAKIESEGIEKQNELSMRLASQANQITNRQWERENSREDKRLKLDQLKSQRQGLEKVLNDSEGLKNSLVGLWSGKGGA